MYVYVQFSAYKPANAKPIYCDFVTCWLGAVPYIIHVVYHKKYRYEITYC
jgi:hypothetical protein